VADIIEATGPATTRQHQLAEVAGIELPEKLPQLIARVRLRAALDLNIATSGHDEPVSDGQLDLIAKLQSEDCSSTFVPVNSTEASTWIYHLTLKKRKRYLETLKIERGDIVKVGMGDTIIEEVTSIGSDGRVYFKGGAGARAWPDLIVVLCRKNTESPEAAELKRKAANRAALRPHASDRWWTRGKQDEMRRFEITSFITSADIDALEEVIERAKDEKPIQEFLQKRPEILAGILNGKERYCIPKLSFDAKYVSDFLVADTDSYGIYWTLVELETPRSSISLQVEDMLDQYARKGVSQIQAWRQYIENNIAHLQAAKEKGGLGLVDITSRARGLVIVGRRQLLRENTNLARRPLRDENNIYIHTYDWLLDRLRSRGAMAMWHEYAPF
jgi:hypothetical protein